MGKRYIKSKTKNAIQNKGYKNFLSIGNNSLYETRINSENKNTFNFPLPENFSLVDYISFDFSKYTKFSQINEGSVKISITPDKYKKLENDLTFLEKDIDNNNEKIQINEKFFYLIEKWQIKISLLSREDLEIQKIMDNRKNN